MLVPAINSVIKMIMALDAVASLVRPRPHTATPTKGRCISSAIRCTVPLPTPTSRATLTMLIPARKRSWMRFSMAALIRGRPRVLPLPADRTLIDQCCLAVPTHRGATRVCLILSRRPLLTARKTDRHGPRQQPQTRSRRPCRGRQRRPQCAANGLSADRDEAFCCLPTYLARSQRGRGCVAGGLHDGLA